MVWTPFSEFRKIGSKRGEGKSGFWRLDSWMGIDGMGWEMRLLCRVCHDFVVVVVVGGLRGRLGGLVFVDAKVCGRRHCRFSV
jgi:hypothetical protein